MIFLRRECADCKHHMGTRIDEYCDADDGEEYFLEPDKCPSFTWRDTRLDITERWCRKMYDLMYSENRDYGQLAECIECFQTELEADRCAK